MKNSTNAEIRQLKGSVSQLLPVGLLAFLCGLFFAVLFIVIPDFRSIVYVPFELAPALLVWYLATVVVPGGTVNYYLAKHTDTVAERSLDTLIARYASKLCVRSAIVVFLVANIVVDAALGNNSFRFDLGGSLFTIAYVYATLAALSQGIKYITAWWNISRKRPNPSQGLSI